MYHLQSSFNSQPALFSPKHPSQIPHFRVYRRRRLKPVPSRHLPVRCQSPGFENILSSDLAHDVVTSLLGFASASAAALSIASFRRNSPPPDVEEWILFSSPTPFNRFVLLRCPSVAFEGSELLEDVNDRLVKEERHFVRINSGRIQTQLRGDGDRRDSNCESQLLKYQRMCVPTEDGGVISLDWPENLDLKEERGLDTTLLLVPGTVQGSMDADVKAFVCEALCRGFFPVVMNPRGCAGSPLTTARLFTAADSDDIHRATQFISKVRPWATLMGVGWGYGANMLTKYLAEFGERTPITAATCINNPFDLEEATRSSPQSIAIDERLNAGLKDILLANKELFQGRAKGFDVEKALSAKTVRNFEQAISMVAYGFEEIAEFYSKSSTRNLVGDLKIPILFIQSDDGTVPLFSIPRGEIAENPYTSLLLCSSLPSGGTGKPALSSCQPVTVEWLAAVELGLLKGRHPLLEDIDISISPPAGLSLVEGRSLDQSSEEDKFLEFTNGSNGYALGTMDSILEDGHGVTSRTSGSGQDPQSGSESGDKDVKVVDNGVLQQSSSGDVLAEKGIEESSTDDDEGQVLQSAEVVMNMLDATLPGVLTEEKKEKVLAAMNRGETLMKALEDAVPEDVRGKLTTSVSGILAAQGAKLRFNEIKHIDVIPSNSKNEEHGSGNLDTNGLHSNNLSPDLMQKVENSGSDGSNDNQEVKDSHVHVIDTGGESEVQMPEDSSEVRSGGSDSEEHSEEKPSNPPNPNRSENESEPVEAAAVEGGADLNSSAVESVTEDLTEEKNVELPIIAEAESPSESQTTEKDTDDDQKSENKDVPPVLDQKTTSSAPDSNMPSFSVTQALDAFSGIDDSTQVAVNSVFGVLEEMITQLEEGSDNQKENEVDAKQIDSPLQKHDIAQDTVYQDKTLDSRPEIGHGSELEEPNQSFADVDGSSGKKHLVNRIGKEKNDMKTQLVNSKLLDSFPYKVGHADSIPFYATPKPYEEFVRDEYVRRYLLSKVPPKSLDMDKTAALFLDYIPEEGQWKFLEEPGQDGDSTEANELHSSAEETQIENMIGPPYVVQGTHTKHSLDKEHEKIEADHGDSRAVELKHFIKKITYDCLRVEVDRRIHLEEMKGIEPNLIRDFDLIGDAVCSTIARDKDMTLAWKTRKNGLDYSDQKLGTLSGVKIVSAVSLAIQETDHLRRLLPVGLVVGSCLAALREYFVITEQDSARTETDNEEPAKFIGNVNGKPPKVEPFLVKYSRDTDVTKENAHHQQHNEKSDEDIPDGSLHQDNKKQMDDVRNSTVMAGVVTAALGTTAYLVHQQGSEEGDGEASSSDSLKQGGGAIHKDLLEASSEKDQTNLVTSLAEKAMSVAAPVVPTREDGEVDQAKIVAMLAELGQRGGMLKLVGKLALLWGGLRGAMSLTDKLISFLHIAERPLILRIIGFMFMVLVLWSPVVVPLLPTLVQGWMSSDNSPKMAELACIVGFYAAVMILLMIWGKRIRKYEKPFQQYGLDFTSIEKVQDLLRGLVGGIVLVSAIQYMNVTLGYMSFSLPPSLFSASSSSSAMAKLKFYGSMLAMAGQGIVTAGAIALVEELLFRSWLPSEIAADLGHHWGIFLSGLIFAMTQRPLWAVPGLLLWSVSLSGLRRIKGGSLSIPIGLRTGIIASSHFLQTGGFLTYKENFPQWITGTQPFQPFSGIVGLAFSLLLAAILYPRGVKPMILNSSRPIRVEELSRPIRED